MYPYLGENGMTWHLLIAEKNFPFFENIFEIRKCSTFFMENLLKVNSLKELLTERSQVTRDLFFAERYRISATHISLKVHKKFIRTQ